MMDTDRLISDKANLTPYGVNQSSAPIPNALHENANQVQPVSRTAPPITQMDRVAGYDNMRFENCKSMYNDIMWLVNSKIIINCLQLLIRRHRQPK